MTAVSKIVVNGAFLFFFGYLLFVEQVFVSVVFYKRFYNLSKKPI